MSSVQNRRGLGRRLLAAARVRPEETKLATRIVVFFAVTQASHGIAANTADALFFQRFGVDQLPLMILLSGPAVMIATLAYSGGLARVGSRRWLPATTSVAAVWGVIEWAAIFTDARFVYPVIWIAAQVLILLTLTVMWNAAASACTTRQAKRLFPLFASAGVAGGVVGNLAVGPLAVLLGTQNLLLVQGVLLVGSTVLVGRLAGFFTDSRDASGDRRGGMRRAMAAIRSSRLLLLAAVVAALLSAVFYMVVFPFSESVAASFDSEAEIAGFLGLFSSVATAATFLFSLLATNRLLARFGVVVTLMIVPAIYALGFSTWLLGFGLVTATLVRGAQWVAVNAIQGTTFSALFNVLGSRQRGPVLALMTAVPAQVGTMAAGVTLLAADALPRSAQFGAGLLLSALALGAVVLMRPAYLDAVVAAVRRGLVGMFDVVQPGLITPVDRDTARVLATHLEDERPEARAFAIAGLARVGGEPQAIEPFLADDDPLVRAAAFDSVCELEPNVVDRHLAEAIADESATVRLHALRHLKSLGDGAVLEVDLGPALQDPDSRVRAAAAWLAGDDVGGPIVREMAAGSDPESMSAVLEELARNPTRPMGIEPIRCLQDENPRVRAAAATAQAAIGADLPPLVPTLDDPSLRVRHASANALAAHQEGRNLLIEVLDEGSVIATEAALRAVSPIQEADSQEFTDWAKREARRAALLDDYRRALEGHETSQDEEYLVEVLGKRADRLVQWVLMAMTTEETSEIMPVVSRGVRSDDPETNSQAVEALETVGARSVLDVLLPLLDPVAGAETRHDHRQALRELSTDFDPWLRALALRGLAQEAETELHDLRDIAAGDASPLARNAVPGLAPMPETGLDKLDEMGRVLVLRRVPMFSELDPEDLLLIAQAAEERHVDSDERIYHEGEEGTELLVIVSGEVVVSRLRDEGRRVIQAYAEGEHVGELSLLSGGKRSADVHAGPEGVHGLVLSKANLLSILEERPSVALGMLGTLAERLVEQT